MKAWLALGSLVVMVGAAGCGPTTETLAVPFELTSGVTKPTSEFTSSSTPGATALSPRAKARQQLETFTAYSYENVRTDVARGNGEYLASLASLAGVPADAREGFKQEMQGRYATMYVSQASMKDNWTRVVNTAWAAGYGRDVREP